MANPIFQLLLILALCLPVPLHGQGTPPSGTRDKSQFVVFIHAGPKLPDAKEIKQIAVALLQKGYLVRAPDSQQDKVGGPGVDYFDDSALGMAQDVADTVNETFGRLGVQVADDKKLKPRRQRVKSPPTYLGVWLF
jgi:hypothetical protein